MSSAAYRGTRLSPDIAVLSPEGDIDTESASKLEGEIESLLADGALRSKPPNLVVDLRSASSIDTSALTALFAAAQRLAASERLLVLITSDPSVRQVLATSGFDHISLVERDLPDAIAGAGGRHLISSRSAAPQAAPGSAAGAASVFECDHRLYGRRNAAATTRAARSSTARDRS